MVEEIFTMEHLPLAPVGPCKEADANPCSRQEIGWDEARVGEAELLGVGVVEFGVL